MKQGKNDNEKGNCSNSKDLSSNDIDGNPEVAAEVKVTKTMGVLKNPLVHSPSQLLNSVRDSAGIIELDSVRDSAGIIELDSIRDSEGDIELDSFRDSEGIIELSLGGSLESVESIQETLEEDEENEILTKPCDSEKHNSLLTTNQFLKIVDVTSIDLDEYNTDSSDNLIGNTDSSDNLIGNTDSSDNLIGNTDSSDNLIGNTDSSNNLIGNTDSSNNPAGNTSSHGSSKHSVFETDTPENPVRTKTKVVEYAKPPSEKSKSSNKITSLFGKVDKISNFLSGKVEQNSKQTCSSSKQTDSIPQHSQNKVSKKITGAQTIDLDKSKFRATESDIAVSSVSYLQARDNKKKESKLFNKEKWNKDVVKNSIFKLKGKLPLAKKNNTDSERSDEEDDIQIIQEENMDRDSKKKEEIIVLSDSD
ncbi:dentin sialophosphoprotein-like [Mytilus edulis]|uniref:dentin sialophosphoprotein-like n=1 Tax=Mytilus edulis TaxID=6550 RepID=UPI0039F02A87